jgi:arylsulfatase A-like enzyme
VAAIDHLGLTDNTIIVFTSDNGGFAGATYAPKLRGSKGMLYEGGIRVPALVHLPQGPQGARVATPIESMDFYPTLMTLSGSRPASGARLDGRDFSAAVRTGRDLPAQPLFWHLPVYLEGNRTFSGSPQPPIGAFRSRPSAAIRDGRYKLIVQYEDNSLELYDLATDLAERNNLAPSMPDLAHRLLRDLQAWQRKTGAPMPTARNPTYNPNFVVSAKSGKSRPSSEGDE